jgi:phosphoglycerol geranylgeranyltransferase
LLHPGKVESLLLDKVRRIGTICAALIDPEDFSLAGAGAVASACQKAGVSLILVGGSTIADQRQLDSVVRRVKKSVRCPVILFPGNITGVSQYADAILFSCLLNSTNPYFIIGAQALGALKVYKSELESIPMGYLVFGNASSTSFVGQTNSIPFDKPGIAVMYSLAAQYLGMRTLYLEAGSGSSETVPPETIKTVRKHYSGLLIVGGGITSQDRAREVSRAGADMIVIGNLLKKEGFEPTLTGIIESMRHQ